MKDLSLNLLDIAENSVKAGATLTQLLLTQEGKLYHRGKSAIMLQPTSTNWDKVRWVAP